jgi:hypothetical protein
MASDWTGSISVAVTEASVGYVATGANPDAIGVAEISGNASLSRISDDAEPPRQEFHISLTIQGQSASEAKREAHLWPDVMNEITDNDDVIGILFKVDEFEQRRGYLYLHPAQYYNLMGNLATSTALTLYSRQGTQSECDLIVSVHLYTKMIAPQQ